MRIFIIAADFYFCTIMMKKTTPLLFLYLLIFNSVLAQRDSLLRLLPHAAADTNKVFLLIHIAEEFEGDDPQRSKGYYRQAKGLSEYLNFKRGIIKSINGYTYLLNIEAAFDSSAILNLQALTLSKELKDTLSMAKSSFNTGNSFRFKGDYSEAVKFFEEGKNYFSKVGNDSLAAIGDDILQGLYTDMNEYEKSREYGERAVAKFRKLKSPYGLCVTLNNLGNNYVQLREFDKAEAAYLEALEISKKINDRNLESSQYINLGDLLLQREEYDDLYLYFSKALKISEELELPDGKLAALLGLSYHYKYQRNYEKAKQLALQALAMAHELNHRTLRKKLYTQLSDLAYAMQEPAAGNHYEVLSSRLADSLLNETLLKNTQELEAKYETVRKQAEINNLKAEKEVQQLSIKNRNMLIAILCILGFLLYLAYRHKQLRISELETEKQLAATEAVLKGEEQERARMAKDLHDGLGGILSGLKYSLNNVRGNLIMTPDNAQAFERSLDMLDSSIGEMRRIAHNMLPEALITFGLDNALNGFCQDITNSGALQVHYQSIGVENIQLDQSKSITIYRIVQELLNNTLKHAAATQAIVQLTNTPEQLSITVEDDGKGFDYKAVKNSKGIGWKNIQNRVNLLNGKLDVDSSENGTSVLIEI
jgi:two-component system, NarL family, sensor kinase